MNGSRPAGETSPTSTRATASPPRVPGYQACTIAATFSSAHRRSSGRPDMTTTTTGVPVAAIRCSCSSCRPGRSRVALDASPPSGSGAVRRRRSRRRRRGELDGAVDLCVVVVVVRGGADGGVHPVELRWEQPVGEAGARSEADSAPPSRARRPSRMVTVSLVSWSNTHGPRMSRLLSASWPMTATFPSSFAGSGRVPVFFRSTIDRSAARDAMSLCPESSSTDALSPRRRRAARTGPAGTWR